MVKMERWGQSATKEKLRRQIGTLNNRVKQVVNRDKIAERLAFLINKNKEEELYHAVKNNVRF
jgi:hypothetical protein